MLAALDCEALFTIAGGLKPVSEGFWRTKIDIRQPQLDEIADTRRALASWRNDELWADIHVLDQEHEGKRFALAWVAHRESLANRVREHRDFFAPYGLMPDTHPAEILAVVERMPRADRHRGQGLLFGYPLHAIDFFCAADALTEQGQPAPERRFVQIPTQVSATGRFVYAVPKNAADREEDRILAEAAAARLSRWRELRSTHDSWTQSDLRRCAETLLHEFSTPARSDHQPAALGSSTSHASIQGSSGSSNWLHPSTPNAISASSSSAPRRPLSIDAWSMR
jgi:hypothetical protein